MILILKDICCLEKDLIIEINELYFSGDYWNILFNPSKYGFSSLDIPTFNYDSQFHSLNTILYLFDVIQDKKIDVDVYTQIQIYYLLLVYGNKEQIRKWKEECMIISEEIDEEPDKDNFVDWMKRNLDCMKWKEYDSNIDITQIPSIKDRYKKCIVKFIDNRYDFCFNERTLGKLFDNSSVSMWVESISYIDSTSISKKLITKEDLKQHVMFIVHSIYTEDTSKLEQILDFQINALFS